MFLRITIMCFICSAFVLCQVPDNIQRYRDDDKGSFSNRQQGILVGNRINTLFYNDGIVGKWDFTPTCEWPVGSGHNNLSEYTFVATAEITAPDNSQIIHPVETAYSEQYNYDPVTSLPNGFEPIAGYSSANTVAASNDKLTWPSQWPAALGLSLDYNGHWYGYFGKDSFNAAQEIYYVMDDSQDRTFDRSPYGFSPDSTDFTRRGLGLRVEVRGFQWNDSLREDIIFFIYSVWNISDFDYDKMVLGLFFEPGVGGANTTMPGNETGIDSANGLVYSWAPSGIGNPGNWKTGYFGIGVLSTSLGTNTKPGLSMVSAYVNSKGPGSLWPKNNDVMWADMTGGIDTTVRNDYLHNNVIGSGPFLFKRWTNTEFASAIIMGSDLNDVLKKKIIAQAIYNNNLIMPDSLVSDVAKENNLVKGFELKQNYPNPFNPSTTISYSIAKTNIVTIKVYDVLGKEVATLVNEEKQPGSYDVNFNASKLTSGVYLYRLQAGSFSETKKFILLK